MFVGCTLLAGLAMTVYYVYIALSPFIFQNDFHVTARMYGWLMVVTSSGGIISKLTSPWIIVRYKQVKSLVIGISILTASGVLLVLLTLFHMLTVFAIIFCIFFASFSIVLIGSNAMSFALSEFNQNRGAASALYSSFQLFLSFALTTVVAYLPHPGATCLAYTLLFLGVCAYGLYSFFIKRLVL